MKNKRDEVIKKLTKMYYLKLTKDCIELSPKLKDAFEIREEVINALKKASEHQ
jgi:hypothetical protein